MNNEDFKSMQNALASAARAFPNCRIANCQCNSKKNEWKKGCYCMCHWLQMDDWFGKDNWTVFVDDNKIRKKGLGVNDKPPGIKTTPRKVKK